MAQNRQDMGSGPVKPLLLQLMIPAVVAQVVNLLYNIVDRIYIGHIEGIGAAALTGVGLFAPILMLLNAFAMLIGAGGAPRTAIALGQDNKDEAEKIIGNSFTMLLFFAVVLTAGFYAGAPALLRLFGASDATLPYAVAYGRIYILGSVFVLLVMGMNPFITTQGFAKISMLTTVIGAVINIILDPILIFGLGWGVRGAAVATVLSQAVGACWILKFLTGPKTILKLRKENLKVERNIILPVLGLGISSFVMLSTESLLSISFSSSLARYGGDVAVGAMTVITSVSQLCTMPIQGICQGGQPVMSFNFGAGKKPRVKEAFRFQLTLCFGYTTLFWLLMMLVPGVVAGIFTSDAYSGHLSGRPAGDELQLRRRQKAPRQGGVPLPAHPLLRLYHPVLAAHDAGPRRGGGHLYLGCRPHRIHHMGHAHLHGGHPRHGRSDRLPAEFYGAGSGQSQPPAGLSAEDHPAYSADFYPALLHGR